MEDGIEEYSSQSLLHADGVLVEICGLTGKAQLANVVEGGVDGAAQNGKKGLAKPHGDGDQQVVSLLDGLCLLVPTENVQPCTQSVTEAVLESLSSKHYCTVQMNQSEELGQNALASIGQRSDFTRPKPISEEAYMGHGPGGQVAWLSDESLFAEDAALQQHIGCITDCLENIGWLAEEQYGFRAPMSVGSLILRRWLPAGSRKTASDLMPSSHDDVQALLEFMQRRKLCVMLVVDGAGALKFSPKDEDSHPVAELSVRNGMLIIFRHDLLFYAYEPVANDVMLQAWLLEQPQVVVPDFVRGSKAEIMSITGASGTQLPPSSATHVLSFDAMCGGNTNSFGEAVMMYASLTDCGVAVPKSRWDNEPYYEFVPDGGYGMTPGKSAINHTSFLQDNQLTCFDHDFFGFTYEDAVPLHYSARMCLQGAYTCLNGAGYTLDTLKGLPMLTHICGLKREGEQMSQFENIGKRFAGTWSEANLISFVFGVVGPAVQVDTACSASLVSINCAYNDMAKVRLGKDHFGIVGEPIRRALIGATSYSSDVGAYIGLTAAHMLGSKGRSLTYDMSACGFARGEGCKMLLMGEQDDLDLSMDQYASILGAFCNQDGRSASLTAPNGPSQSACIRSSLRCAGRDRAEVLVSETHGTGTALGDPIEVGGVRAVFFGRSEPRPLFYAAGKSYTSHLEMGAGLAGFIKTTITCMYSMGLANCHLRELNNNIETEGYPAFWPNELIDAAQECNHGALSSFGFGGTNARADLWASCKKGPRKVVPMIAVGSEIVARISYAFESGRFRSDLLPSFTVSCPKCLSNMCPLCKEVLTDLSVKHTCSAVRSEFCTYDVCSNCFKGGYMVAPPVVDAGDLGQRVYIVSSSTNWMLYEEMQQTIDGYMHFLKLGDSQVVQFHIVLDKNPECAIYPSSDDADQDDGVHGPDQACGGRSWKIDGRASNLKPGALYLVNFTWDYGIKQISWTLVTANMKHSFTKAVQELIEADTETTEPDSETVASDASAADA